jgi:myo-inositol 2-dehydrogenase/D-chiro-inositol 1-dehydrogenase
MTLRVGVIGAGGMGREHITNLAVLEGVEVHIVADVVVAGAEAGAALAGPSAAAVTDPMAVATHPDLDAVVIASPDDTHAELAIAAIEAGLAVLCEKPLAVTVADAERVVAAEAAAPSSLVQVGLMRVYDPAHQQVADAMMQLGPLHHLRLVHRNTNAQWERSLETVFSQSLIHDIHSARWFSGSEFGSVVAQVVRTGARINYVNLLGELASGATVSIEFAEATYGYDVEVEATCEHGMAIAAQPAQPVVRRDGRAHRHIGDDWFGRFTDAYRTEAAEWTSGVLAGQVRGPTATDGLAAQRVVAAAIESAETGARVTVIGG